MNILFLFVLLLIKGSTGHIITAPHIVGGVPVKETDELRNWVVSLKRKNFTFCSGSLIAPKWVLTAAHCVKNSSKPGLQVLAGVVNLTENHPERQERNVVRIIKHEKYDVVATRNDIALLELETPIDTLKPVGLINNPTQEEVGDLVYTAGFGILVEGGTGNNLMNKVGVPIVSYAQCTAKGSYRPEDIIDSMAICAGFKNGGKDSCQGDSGGPLYAIDSDSSENTLIGVVSWGIGCARPNKYGIYTRVSYYVNWISNITGITLVPTSKPTKPSARPTTLKPSTARPSRRPSKYKTT